MKLTLTDLSILIELTEREQYELIASINDTKTEEGMADANAEYLVQVGNVAGVLKSQYEALWTEGCNYQSYADLIKEIEGQLSLKK